MTPLFTVSRELYSYKRLSYVLMFRRQKQTEALPEWIIKNLTHHSGLYVLIALDIKFHFSCPQFFKYHQHVVSLTELMQRCQSCHLMINSQGKESLKSLPLVLIQNQYRYRKSLVLATLHNKGLSAVMASIKKKKVELTRIDASLKTFGESVMIRLKTSVLSVQFTSFQLQTQAA